LSNVLVSNIVTAANDFGPSLGAAILAGVGTGAFASIDEAIEKLVVIDAEIAPEPTEVQVYRQYRSVYTTLYPGLQDQFARLGKLV
jgi:xylulokinase